MSYTTTIGLILSESGLTLNGQLSDSAGNNVGSLITTGFFERADGNYGFTVTIPSGHRGLLDIINAADSKVLTVVSINPEELENTDVKTSSITSGNPLNAQVPGSFDAGSAGDVLGHLASVTVVGISTPSLSEAGDLTIIQGDSYELDQGRQIDFSEPDDNVWPSLADGPGTAACAFKIFNGRDFISSKAMTIIVATGTGKKVRLQLIPADTNSLTLDRYSYHVVATLGDGDIVTLARGRFILATP